MFEVRRVNLQRLHIFETRASLIKIFECERGGGKLKIVFLTSGIKQSCRTRQLLKTALQDSLFEEKVPPGLFEAE